MAKRDVGRSYWLPASVPLTSTNGEKQFGTTVDAKAAVDVLGAITNLTVSTAKLRDVSGNAILADEFMPIFSLYGRKGHARHIFYWPRPFRLGFGNRLEAEVQNHPSAAEAAGHLVYVGIPAEAPQAQIEGLENLGNTRGFSIDAKFTSTANEITTRQSPTQEHDFLIHGAYTDLVSAQLRIQGVNGEQWMNDWCPVWALAGKATEELPVLMWPRPYLIPKGSTITVDFKNAGTEAAGLKLYLVGQKL